MRHVPFDAAHAANRPVAEKNPMKRERLLLALATLTPLVASAGFTEPSNNGTQATSVTYATIVNGDLDDVRTAIANPAWHHWIPFLSHSECSGAKPGDVRVCTMKDPGGKMDGFQVRETILENDQAAGRFSYSIENPPLPVMNLVGTVETKQAGDKTLVMWTAKYQVADENAEMVRSHVVQLYQGALMGLEMNIAMRK